ncbi:hypothetical protein V2J09_011196 [Rumex salicifolius]
MKLCKFFRYPDLFITFTYNRGLKPEDRPDILNDIVKYIKNNKVFGEVKALPTKRTVSCSHFIFLNQKAKNSNVVNIDNIIPVQILDPVTYHYLFRVVSEKMVYVPLEPRIRSLRAWKVVDAECTIQRSLCK